MSDWLRLRPAPDQYQNFAEYLCDAHSWYKHLPLYSGSRFVVFVAPDAGGGRLVADSRGDGEGYSIVSPPEGPEFTDANPRLHFGWQTTSEYRSRFGYLDYSWIQTEDGSWARDVGPPLTLPSGLVERCEFVLYPYVSAEFAEAITWDVHAEALEQLRSGATHPCRNELLELARLAEALEQAWDALNERERDWIVASDEETAEAFPEAGSQIVRRYLALDDQVNANTGSLQEQEAAKVRRALAALDEWLVRQAD